MKYTKFTKDGIVKTIKDNDTKQIFAPASGNKEYQSYLAWVALGNTADEVVLGELD